jgi:outer membrane protein TolC
MKNRLKWIMLNLVFLMGTFIISAQGISFPVTLESVLQLSGANNLTVQEYQLKHKQALAEQSKAKEWWLPEIQAGYSTHFLNGAAMNTDGNIFTDVDRNNLWLGLGISVEIDFKDGFYKTLAAKKKSEAANYFTIAQRNQVILKSVQTYFDLQTEQLKYSFLQNMASQADTIAQQLKVQVDAGLRFQSEYLLAQSNYNHIKISMLQAKTEWRKKSALLTNLLDLEGITYLVSADTLLLPLAFIMPSVDTISVEKRPEYLGLNTELSSIHAFRKTENQGLLLPKLKVGFDNGAFGAYSDPLYNTYQFNASLLWSLPLGRITHRSDLKKWDAKIMSQQNKVEQFKNRFNQEITTSIAELEIVEQQIEIAKDALSQIAESLRQSIERQKIAEAEPFEVFQAQQFYLQVQLDYLQAVSEYNKSQFALKVAMGEIL